ncbi:CAP domain-containing protein [Streptomyces sp. NPDC005322]|uniref:CAP domain-containing protein n=1 Tax=unclassified Streptomyces TaxID=2593676 RepID=UPI0033B807D2
MSAAVAVGAAAMASGLVPGGDQNIGGGNDSAGQVQAGGPTDSGLEAQGSESASPTDRSRVPASRGDDRPHAPSTTPSKKPTTPPRTPSTTPPSQPGSSDTAQPGGSHGNGGGKGNGGNHGSGSGSGSAGKGSSTPSDTPSTEPTGDASTAEPGGGKQSAVESQILKRVNKERAKVGCSPVTADPKLGQLAQDFSDDMSLRGFFDHLNPDGDSPWDRAQSAGILDLGGENIARGQMTAQAVMDSWMDSTGHRANILNCSYKTMGVGAHFGPGGPWWTQEFGY